MRLSRQVSRSLDAPSRPVSPSGKCRRFWLKGNPVPVNDQPDQGDLLVHRNDVRAVAGRPKSPRWPTFKKTLQSVTDDTRNVTSRWVCFLSSLTGSLAIEIT